MWPFLARVGWFLRRSTPGWRTVGTTTVVGRGWCAAAAFFALVAALTLALAFGLGRFLVGHLGHGSHSLLGCGVATVESRSTARPVLDRILSSERDIVVRLGIGLGGGPPAGGAGSRRRAVAAAARSIARSAAFRRRGRSAAGGLVAGGSRAVFLVRAPPPPASPRRSRNWTRSAWTLIFDRFSPVVLSSQVSILREPSTWTWLPFFRYWQQFSAWRSQTVTSMNSDLFLALAVLAGPGPVGRQPELGDGRAARVLAQLGVERQIDPSERLCSDRPSPGPSPKPSQVEPPVPSVAAAA